MDMVKSGIDALGDLSWGTHFCHFYHDSADLIDTLVPFFKAGLEHREKCLWITSEPLPADKARALLKEVVPDLAELERTRQIEIYDYSEWYLKTGTSDTESTIQSWVDMQAKALEDGYNGMRLSGNAYWLERKDWKAFAAYEAQVNAVFKRHRVIGLCSYCMEKSLSSDVFDVVRNHDFALLRQEGNWELLETSKTSTAKNELQKLNMQLKENLRREKEAAEAADRLKTSFLANMSHEIRTPLGAILGFSEQLSDPTLCARDRVLFNESITRNGEALTRLIDDILDLAKVESGRMEIESVEVSLRELLAEVIELFRHKSKSKGLALELAIQDGVPSQINSDPVRLRQILMNLIGNAVKFTAEGEVRVVVRCADRSEFTEGEDHLDNEEDSERAQLIVEVHDTGIGLSPEQRERLFQPFVQADNSMTRKFGGTGLGLALSDRLARALGGHIKILRSNVNEGSTFSFHFPATRIEQQATPRPPEGAHSFERSSMRPLEAVRILLVDDSPDNLLLAQRYLVKAGAEVETACNGQEAIEAALAGDHNLILMDIQMPVMDGYQAAIHLHNLGYDRPLIALTAHAMLEERERTKSAGFVHHLTKPINSAELVSVIAEICG